MCCEVVGSLPSLDHAQEDIPPLPEQRDVALNRLQRFLRLMPWSEMFQSGILGEWSRG